MALSLVSVNIEWDKHLDTVLPFLREERADVTCVQELLEQDIALFEEACGQLIMYSPVGYLERGTMLTIGCGIFSRVPFIERGERYYVGARDTIRVDDEKSDIGTHVLSYGSFAKEGVEYRIATTHLTWSKDGESTAEQLEDLNKLFAELDSIGEFALCGDFNAPRGRETFSRLAAKYQDNIPTECTTSIDMRVHKTKDIPEARARVATYMVDGLFTTPGYSAKDVRLQFGVSDHAAIVATIEKAP